MASAVKNKSGRDFWLSLRGLFCCVSSYVFECLTATMRVVGVGILFQLVLFYTAMADQYFCLSQLADDLFGCIDFLGHFSTAFPRPFPNLFPGSAFGGKSVRYCSIGKGKSSTKDGKLPVIAVSSRERILGWFYEDG